MNITDMANDVLAAWIALYHFAAIHIFPTVGNVFVSMSALIIAPMVLFWRPVRARKAVAVATKDIRGNYR